MAASELDNQLTALFRARPELRLALPYLKDDAGTAQLALAGIARQWVEAVYGIDETTVAASKLHWWADELVAARDGHTHHPLATALFAADQAHQLDPGLWQQAIEAGLALREQPPAADFVAQVAAAEAFHGALARLETALCFGPDCDGARAARLSSLSHLLSSLPHLGKSRVENDGLPMRLLARHGLDRSSLGKGTAAREAAVRDQLADLQSAFADAMYLPGRLSLSSELSWHADRAQLRRALKSGQPLVVLASPRGRMGPILAIRAWRGARRRHRTDR